MGLRRWPVVFVAFMVGGMVLAPDDAGADATHDRVTTTFAGGGAHVLVVQHARASLLVSNGPCARVRGRALNDHGEKMTLDPSDPWTGEQIASERVAAPARQPLDDVDPWNGTTIVVPGSAIAELTDSKLDPYVAD